MTLFSLSDDIVLKILFNLEDDPRDLASLACVCTKLSSLIRHICWKSKCFEAIPDVVDDLVPPPPLSSSSSSLIDCPPGGWSALHKLCVCCPGLHHAGVLLENSDFGLERELGPDEDYQQMDSPDVPSSTPQDPNLNRTPPPPSADVPWSLYDDLYLDFAYDVSETQARPELPELERLSELSGRVVIDTGDDVSIQTKKRKKCESTQSHLASSTWKLTRDQGNKLLESRFRGDCLYICDWPGCIHTEEKRSYMLFRGIFKDFKKSQVWRTINDGNRSKIRLDCAFCPCEETWDLHSAFCLKRVFGYHDNGEPVVRAYVCENGHVSGAWTERPMYA